MQLVLPWKESWAGSRTEDDISVSEAEAFFTDPAEARYFVEQTGVDALAISIGTAQVAQRGARLDFARLKRSGDRTAPSCCTVLRALPMRISVRRRSWA